MASERKIVNVELLVIRQPGMDTEELDRLTREVLADLRELDLESAELGHATEAPIGTKSAVEAIAVGAIVVQVLPHVLPKLVEFLGKLVDRKRPTIEASIKAGEREVTLKYTPGETSQADVDRVLASLKSALGEEPRIITA